MHLLGQLCLVLKTFLDVLCQNIFMGFIDVLIIIPCFLFLVESLANDAILLLLLFISEASDIFTCFLKCIVMLVSHPFEEIFLLYLKIPNSFAKLLSGKLFLLQECFKLFFVREFFALVFFLHF